MIPSKGVNSTSIGNNFDASHVQHHRNLPKFFPTFAAAFARALFFITAAVSAATSPMTCSRAAASCTCSS